MNDTKPVVDELEPAAVSYAPGTPVFPRDRAVGTGRLTGKKYPCQMQSCWGLRLATRWPDGKITYPCTRGMTHTEEGWRIL